MDLRMFRINFHEWCQYSPHVLFQSLFPNVPECFLGYSGGEDMYLCQNNNFPEDFAFLNVMVSVKTMKHDRKSSSSGISQREVMQVSFGGFNSPEKRIKWLELADEALK